MYLESTEYLDIAEFDHQELALLADALGVLLGCRPAAGVKVDGRRFLRRAANSRRRTYARDTTSIAC
jgi:hypothetical protein